MKNYILAIVIVVLVLVVYQSYQISSLQDSFRSPAGNAVAGALDMSGWTDDEKMMYEHHGTLPARLQGTAQQQQASQMVGGC